MQVIKHEECPQCHGKQTAFNGAAQQLVKDGRVKQFLACASRYSSVIGTQEVIDNLKVGESLPAITIYTDACVKCGCMYAYLIEIGSVTKREKKPTLILPPNRRPGNLS